MNVLTSHPKISDLTKNDLFFSNWLKMMQNSAKIVFLPISAVLTTC